MRLLVCCCAVVLVNCGGGTKLNGLCYASWLTAGSESYDSDESDLSIKLATSSGINMLAVTNTWYMQTQNSTSIAFSDAKSNTDAGVTRAVKAARANGLRVSLKPHVDFIQDPSHWRGQIGPAFTSNDWAEWFASYSAFIQHEAKLAKALAVDMFVIGTELATTEGHVEQWRSLISTVRSILGNETKLTYAANWGPGETPGIRTTRMWECSLLTMTQPAFLRVAPHCCLRPRGGELVGCPGLRRR